MTEIQENKIGYKQTKLGWIPEDWEVDSISNHTAIKTGNSDTQDREDDGLYPFFVRSNTIERINKYSFDGEAVLTSGDGVGVGKIYHYIDGKFDYHQRVYNIHGFASSLDGKFFYYFFSNHFYRRVMSMTAKGSVDSVRMEMIAKMLIPLPPLPEQQKIAAILITWDKAINKLETLISEKETLKKGLMQVLLTGKKRFSGFTEEWKEVKLGDVTTLLKDGTHGTHKDAPGSNFILLSAKNLKNGKVVFDDSDRRISEDEFNMIYKNYNLQNNDVLLSVVGTVGRVSIVNDLHNIAFQRSVAFFRFPNDVPNFMVQLMSGEQFQSELSKRQVVSAQPGIYLGDLSKIPLALPKIEEQQKIASVLSAADKEIETLKKELNSFKEQKRGLMQKLLTGDVRVKI